VKRARKLTESIRRRQQEGLMPVLSEIKVRSPLDGDLLRGRDPESLALTMGSCPIAGLSVVTEPRDFGGELALIPRVRPHVPVPILRKDYTASEVDLKETVEAGASAVLLTVALLDDQQLALLHTAAQARGLETLVEIHTAEESERVEALLLRPDILGINNKDILVGETDAGDVSLTEQLAPLAPEGSLVLSESSIRSRDDAARAREAGADAVLVGTSILLAPDPVAVIDALVHVGWP
jgi:indole-3-glycerol phosphate synthase